MVRQLDFSDITVGTEIPFNEDVQLPDGTRGHFHVENPVVDNDGKVIGFVVSFHDEGEQGDGPLGQAGPQHRHDS